MKSLMTREQWTVLNTGYLFLCMTSSQNNDYNINNKIMAFNELLLPLGASLVVSRSPFSYYILIACADNELLFQILNYFWTDNEITVNLVSFFRAKKKQIGRDVAWFGCSHFIVFVLANFKRNHRNNRIQGHMLSARCSVYLIINTNF